MCHSIIWSIITLIGIAFAITLIICIQLSSTDIKDQLDVMELPEIYDQLKTIQDQISLTDPSECPLSEEMVTNISKIIEQTLHFTSIDVNIKHQFNETNCRTEFDIEFCNVPQETIDITASVMNVFGGYFFKDTSIKLEDNKKSCDTVARRRQLLLYTYAPSGSALMSGKLRYIGSPCQPQMSQRDKEIIEQNKQISEQNKQISYCRTNCSQAYNARDKSCDVQKQECVESNNCIEERTHCREECNNQSREGNACYKSCNNGYGKCEVIGGCQDGFSTCRSQNYQKFSSCNGDCGETIPYIPYTRMRGMDIGYMSGSFDENKVDEEANTCNSVNLDEMMDLVASKGYDRYRV